MILIKQIVQIFDFFSFSFIPQFFFFNLPFGCLGNRGISNIMFFCVWFWKYQFHQTVQIFDFFPLPYICSAKKHKKKINSIILDKMVAGGKKNLESYFCWNKFANCKIPIFVWISAKNQRRENDMMEVVWVKEFKLNNFFILFLSFSSFIQK